MDSKRFILNADDFGMSKAINKAVLEGYQNGLIKSVSLVANGLYFDEALDIIHQCPDIGIGVHLNILEGKALCKDLGDLIDSDGNFCNTYFKLLKKSYNKKDKEFLSDIEREFRRQIETVMSKTKVSHIDSHSHIHSIPIIFDLVCRLAKEYGIKQVRTHFERIYIIPDVHRHFSWQYIKNVFQVLLLGAFTIVNENTIHKYELKTNDYLVGLVYNTMVDALALSYGVMAIKYNNVIVEAIIHPSRYEDGTIDNRFNEFLLTRNKKLKEKIEKLGFEITNYVEKDS